MGSVVRFFLAAFCFVFLFPESSLAHQSGCHSWHSCPPDETPYTCGDRGHCKYCPDNKFCKSRKLRATPLVEENSEDLSLKKTVTPMEAAQPEMFDIPPKGEIRK